MPNLLPGYTRLPNRAYRNDATGEVIGRREYDRRNGRWTRASAKLNVPVASNESLRKITRTKEYAGERLAPEYGRNSRYQRVVDEYRWWQRYEGRDLSYREAQREIKEKAIMKGLRSRDKSSDGPKAKALEAIGRRRPGDRHRVGDTPVIVVSPLAASGYSEKMGRHLL